MTSLAEYFLENNRENTFFVSFFNWRKKYSCYAFLCISTSIVHILHFFPCVCLRFPNDTDLLYMYFTQDLHLSIEERSMEFRIFL